MIADAALLRRAADYALDAVDTTTPDLWSRATPCTGWNLRMLLRHSYESVTALHEGLATGRIVLCPGGGAVEPGADVANDLRACVAMLLDDWCRAGDHETVAIADRDLTVSVLAGAAAIEIAVHGWDIAQASGYPHPIPLDLGADLLAIATRLLSDGNRHPLFAPPVPLDDPADPSEKLLAFLGRQPRRASMAAASQLPTCAIGPARS